MMEALLRRWMLFRRAERDRVLALLNLKTHTRRRLRRLGKTEEEGEGEVEGEGMELPLKEVHRLFAALECHQPFRSLLRPDPNPHRLSFPLHATLHGPRAHRRRPQQQQQQLASCVVKVTFFPLASFAASDRERRVSHRTRSRKENVEVSLQRRLAEDLLLAGHLPTIVLPYHTVRCSAEEAQHWLWTQAHSEESYDLWRERHFRAPIGDVAQLSLVEWSDLGCLADFLARPGPPPALRVWRSILGQVLATLVFVAHSGPSVLRGRGRLFRHNDLHTGNVLLARAPSLTWPPLRTAEGADLGLPRVHTCGLEVRLWDLELGTVGDDTPNDEAARLAEHGISHAPDPYYDLHTLFCDLLRHPRRPHWQPAVLQLLEEVVPGPLRLHDRLRLPLRWRETLLRSSGGRLPYASPEEVLRAHPFFLTRDRPESPQAAEPHQGVPLHPREEGAASAAAAAAAAAVGGGRETTGERDRWRGSGSGSSG